MKLEVLHSRILALLRRAGGQGHTHYFCGDITLDTEKKQVRRGEEEVALSRPEYEILLLLLKNKGRTVTRNQILSHVWDSQGSFVNDNTLTVAMKRLREKLHHPASLKTVRSFGYPDGGADMTEKKMKTAELLLPVLACLAAIFILSLMWQQQYERAAFSHLSAYTEAFLEQYPKRGERFGGPEGVPVFGRQGCLAERFSGTVWVQRRRFSEGRKQSGYGAALAAAALSAVISLSFWKKDRRCQKRIRELTGYLERVNTQAAGILIQGREDDFSRLQDEIYKTVTNLYAVKEEAVKGQGKVRGASGRYCPSAENAHYRSASLSGASGKGNAERTLPFCSKEAGRAWPAGGSPSDSVQD